ncbi:MAG: phosphoribosylanthranilate isomerase [Alphaproteobacteria bacterium]|nr:phosphoribosylanthranilate isomerase [Alphaproteobacteria bacterium]
MSYSPIIKICGVRSPKILEAVIETGADMVGFVHFPRSPRHVELDPLTEMISLARGRIESVVLLVNPDNSQVAEIAALDPDWIQLHGPESPHRVDAIRAGAGIPILKAIGIGASNDLDQIGPYEEVCDRLLLDAKAPKNSELPGGRGVAFDWQVLAGLDQEVGFMLSGGLTPKNVGEALKKVRPLGIDVSSGVEREPGVKDAALIADFISAARAAAAEL